MRNRVCVQLGNNLFKIIVGSYRGDFKIDKYINVDMPEISGLGKEDFDETELSDIMTAAFRENNIPKKRVRLVLSCISKLLLREISLPITSKRETFKMVKYEFQQFFPGDITDYVLDYKLLNINNTENRQDLLLIAVPKNLIEKILLACKTSGLKVEKIDIEANTLAKYTAHSFKDSEEINSQGMIINIEKNFVTVALLKNSNLAMAKTFPAELEDFHGKGENADAESSDEVIEIVEHISKFANFYISREHQEINWIYITGELSDNKNLTELTVKRLDIPTLQVDKKGFETKSVAAMAGGLI